MNPSDANESEAASPAAALRPASPEVIARLVLAHREFLAFLEARLRDRAVAEDVLQAAFVKALERGGAIRDEESAVAWFYRLLRNALVDHWRRRGREARVLDPGAGDDDAIAEDPGLLATVCRCFESLLPTLKPEYAEVVRRVDLGGRPVAEVAGELGITANNASVRLHRARQALRRSLEASCGTCATHGCLDCECGGPQSGRPGPA
ncbi:MAG: RNA polymerase sigma factor [Candidatus Eisenbacteria bacterium]|nr:RNA polymerase sigma factor [Candidatus Eisenbacteria bacterium]